MVVVQVPRVVVKVQVHKEVAAVALSVAKAAWEMYLVWENLMYKSMVLIKRSRLSLSTWQAWKLPKLRSKSL